MISLYAIVDKNGNLAVKKSGGNGLPVYQTLSKAETNKRHWMPHTTRDNEYGLNIVKYIPEELKNE